MSSNLKHTKRDPMTKDDAADSNVSMALINSLLEGYKDIILSEFRMVTSALDTKIDQIRASISDREERIASLEANVNSVSDCLTTLEATCSELTASDAKLKAKDL